MLGIIFTVAAIIAGIIWIQSKKEDPVKLLGIYSQPGKWYYLKYYFILAVLKLRRLSAKALKKGHSEVEMERMKQLSEHEKAFDAVFFQAITQDGYYLAAGNERRHEAKTNGLFYLATPDLGLLLSKELPNTELDTDPVSIYTMKEWSAGGIRFQPVKPMNVWKFSFNGQMRHWDAPEKVLDVSLEAEWTAESPHFLFDTDLSDEAVARAMAREEWSRQYFKNLKEAHQTHYEQMGRLKGTLTINGEKRALDMDAFRDHSFGNKRDWLLMHRYIFHMFYLSDGTKMSIGVASQPCTASHLELGFVSKPDKSVHAIDSCDLILYQHGENGKPPKNLSFSFTANGEKYEASVEVEYEAVHFVGNNREARMVERFIKCTVNGVTGRGISEWHYNNAVLVR